MSTVFALSSAPGPAGVAVVRVTGPQAGKALRALSGKLPRPRQATLAALRRPVSGEVLDRGLVLWFPAPASVTGEDVAELQIHGGRAVVRAVLDALAALPGLAQAEPGDFTRRAFQNGKLDLTQVEALADLVNAETEGQRRQAQRQMDGELGQRLERWRTEVLRALAHVEAAIDFGEDEVPPAEVLAGVAARVHRLVPEMEEALGEARRGERLRTGVQITIVGPPNAGKSSLLNAIAGRDAAIVSSRAGTTRDVVEVHLDLAGVPVTLADTAGLREACDEIEGEGIRRAVARSEQADVRVAVFDAADWPALDERTLATAGPDAMVVVNKVDTRLVPDRTPSGRPVWPVSAKTGAGIRTFVQELARHAGERAGMSEEPGLTSVRQIAAVRDCVEALRRFLSCSQELALRAEDLRLAARALGRVTGRVDVEELLDVVFRDFCIGK
ncbi:MAG: tRNA uridine-5-carboxymethylaminomethyl(34) synthesis GTPase MnmE [Alphaproteobacteria bacterium]|nr:tRNA uridine-5-carboxymethylaminomethyl(34) synthesis GTPase MnmE [Alphaproteobacteria bacterium]